MTRDRALVEALAADWRGAEIDDRLRAILGYAEKLTGTPAAVEEADLEPLREAGLDDRAILDVVQVTAYYNYVNRMADGLGVELEEGWPEAVRRGDALLPGSG